VQKHRGRAGIDDGTIAAFETRQGYYVARLHRQRRDGTYRPQPVTRVARPQPDGGGRKLGSPAVLDRVGQQALVPRMEPIFAPPMRDCAFGYRPGRAPHRARRQGWQALHVGNVWIVEAELRPSLDTIAQDKRMDVLAEELSAGRGLQLVRHILRAGAGEEGYW
jgi:RNA-directed DNA polymerase